MNAVSVKKTSQLYDESSGSWFDIYQVHSIGGAKISVQVPRSDRSVAKVRKYLLDKGATVAAVSDDHKLVSVINSEPPVAYRASGTGWQRQHTSFVCPHYVVPQPTKEELLPPEHSMASTGQISLKGTLKAWQGLAAIANHSTTMILCLSSAFAAPLISLLNRQSFALVLVGPSRSGKSTAQILAASVLGFGSEEDLPSLNATRAGLLATALTFNDLLLPINEVGTASGSKDEVYIALRDATYSLMGGQDVNRHPSWNSNSAGSPRTFRTLCLFSSEISPDAWAARNAQTRDDGELARLIGIPVPLSASSTIFDRAPKMCETELPSWEKAQFDSIRSGLPEQRGQAFRRFLSAVVTNCDDVRKRAVTLASKFEARLGGHAKSAVGRDIVAKFALIYAGGVLASELEVSPLKPAAVFNAVRKSCLSALAELPDHNAELSNDLEKLKAALSSAGIVHTEAAAVKKLNMLQNADGFSRAKLKGREYVLRGTYFSKLFPSPLRLRRVLDWLDDEGFLMHTRERSVKRSNEWAQTQVTWPNETRVRSVVVYLPAGLDDIRA